MDEQKPGRRIVGRREYVWQVARKSAWSGVGIGCRAFSLVLLLLGGFLLIQTLVAYRAPFLFIASVSALVISAACKYSVPFLEKRADAIQVDLPFTRANIAAFPAETLVRASTDPVEQQADLLRAASQSDTTPAEQLVRPAGGNGE